MQNSKSFTFLKETWWPTIWIERWLIRIGFCKWFSDSYIVPWDLLYWHGLSEIRAGMSDAIIVFGWIELFANVVKLTFMGLRQGLVITSQICMYMPLVIPVWIAMLVVVMVWRRQVTNCYLNQCWPGSMTPYGVTIPQWFQCVFNWYYHSLSFMTKMYETPFGFCWCFLVCMLCMGLCDFMANAQDCHCVIGLHDRWMRSCFYQTHTDSAHTNLN